MESKVQHLLNNTPHYNLYTYNCGMVVQEILSAAGLSFADTHIPDWDYNIGKMDACNTGWQVGNFH